MRRHAPRPDEADKTVMGASRTGSYEVTDVEPGDVQWTGPPGPIDESSPRQRSVGQAESQTSPGDPVHHILTVRRVLEGLAGGPFPPSWDDVTAARRGTGREPLTAEDRAALGSLADRFPLFG